MLRQAICAGIVFFALPVWAQSNLYQQGLDALQVGHYQEAISSLEQHTRLQPKDIKALQALSEAYLQLKSLELAEVTLKAAHELDRNDSQTHYLRGQLRFLQMDYNRALSEFKTVIYLKKTNGGLFYHLALTYEQMGQLDLAREALKNALDIKDNPTSIQAQIFLLQARLLPEFADTALEQALTLQGLKPELEAEIIQLQADYLLKAGRSNELITRQIKRIEQALNQSQAETLPKLINELDQWIGKSDNLEQDKMLMRQALETLYDRYPQQAFLRQVLIQTYLRSELYEELLAFYRVELQINRSKMTNIELAAAFHRMADIHLKLGYLQFAFNNYQSASDKNPNDLIAFKRMGIIYLSARDASEALKTLNKVKNIQPLDYENILLLSLTYAYKQEDDIAKQFLAQVPVDLYPHIRAQIEATLNSQNREANTDLWKSLILPEQILSQ